MLVWWMGEWTDIVTTVGITGTMIYIMEGVNYSVCNMDGSKEEIAEDADHPKEEKVTKGKSLHKSSNKPTCVTRKGHSQHRQHNRKASMRKKTGTRYEEGEHNGGCRPSRSENRG